MSEMYPYTTADFEKIPASRIHEGDYLSMGGFDGHYGAMQVDEVQHSIQGRVIITCRLPVGKNMSTVTGEHAMQVSWDGDTPIIQVVYFFDEDELLMVKKRS